MTVLLPSVSAGDGLLRVDRDFEGPVLGIRLTVASGRAPPWRSLSPWSAQRCIADVRASWPERS